MNVLFVCVQNAGRSQIAEALFTRAAVGRHAARSAGSSPARAVHPEVAGAMRLPLEQVRAIRDEIGRRVEALLGELDGEPAGEASAA